VWVQRVLVEWSLGWGESERRERERVGKMESSREEVAQNQLGLRERDS